MTPPRVLCPQTPLELLQEFNDAIDYGVTPISYTCQVEANEERFFENNQLNLLLLRPKNIQENRLSSQDGKEYHIQDTGNNQLSTTKNDLPEDITFQLSIFSNKALTVTPIPSTGSFKTPVTEEEEPLNTKLVTNNLRKQSNMFTDKKPYIRESVIKHSSRLQYSLITNTIKRKFVPLDSNSDEEDKLKKSNRLNYETELMGT